MDYSYYNVCNNKSPFIPKVCCFTSCVALADLLCVLLVSPPPHVDTEVLEGTKPLRPI